MTLSPRLTALVVGLLWGGLMLVVGIANHLEPRYGMEFLRMVSSVYPGYHPQPTWTSVVVGTLYGFVDGAIGGFLFAWLYDFVLSRHSRWRRKVGRLPLIRGGLSDAAFALGLASSLGGKRIAFDRFVLIEDNVEIFGLA